MTVRPRGQSLVEFALLMPVLVLSIWGCVDVGRWEQVRVSLSNADRIAARFAATTPTAWSNAASPPSSSIEGRLRQAAQGTTVINDDAHISIAYYDTSTTSPTLCGRYSAASNAWVAASGTTYTEATCVLPGSLIRVTVTATFTPSTPALSEFVPSVTLTDTSQVLEEQ
ncbi:MAG: TadE/TadG family type IV pilus assembly protein [Candidatus Dormibacteria bacterium]